MSVYQSVYQVREGTRLVNRWKKQWAASIVTALLVGNSLGATGIGFAQEAGQEWTGISASALSEFGTSSTNQTGRYGSGGPSFRTQLETGTLPNNGTALKAVGEVTYGTDGPASVINTTYEPGGEVIIMVELDGAPLLSRTSAQALRSRISSFSTSENNLEVQHRTVKNRIQKLAEEEFAEQAAAEEAQTEQTLNQQGLMGQALRESKLAVPSTSSTELAEAPEIEVLYDYYMVMNAFSIKADYSNLEGIQQLPGVKNAWVATTYGPIEPVESIGTLMESSSAMIGANTANSSGYTGKGTTVAVVDTGLDWKHEAFSKNMPPALTLKHTRQKVSNVLGSTSMSSGISDVDAVYVNDKVPYAYDYADKDTNVIPSGDPDNEHGTHVAGIVAANGDRLKGVAPDAQLMIMKVFDDMNGSTNDASIIAALEDSVKLGADVINMSLGANAGFSTEGEASKDEMYDRIGKAGVNLVVAAGNSYSSAYGNQSGQNLPFATDPDSSIVASPSTYASALSVASMANMTLSDVPYIAGGDRKIVFNDQSYDSDPKIQGLNDTYDYIHVGLGSTTDIQNAGNLKGKIALISRGGEISFQQKLNNAYAAGAVAVVVYNNVAGQLKMDIGSYYIPAVAISQNDGEYLAGLQTKKLTLSDSLKTSITNPEGGNMSAFSSWGVAPDLKLKPEITAPGEGIYSTVLGNAYKSMSGTSMASPHIAGAEALVKQYVTNTLSITDPVTQEKLVHSLLMSTAHPAKDASSGQFYSPRKQGAGLADVTGAITTGAYLSVEGNDRPKAELGDGKSGSYSFTFRIHSISDEELTYELNTAALSENVITSNGKSLLEQKSTDYAGNGINIQYGAATNGKVTVPARGSAAVTVTITLSDAMKAQFNRQTPNGTFVDGFVMLDADSGVDLSLPFLAFYGDWGQLPMLDGTEYGDEGYSMFGSTVYNAFPEQGNVLGQNHIAIAKGLNWGVMPEKFAISPQSLGNSSKILGTNTGLLRNAEDMSFTVMGKDGHVYKETNYSHVRKSLYFPSLDLVSWAEALLGTAPTFDGLDANNSEVPEGMYTYKVEATAAGTNGQGKDTWSFDFAYDKTGPVLTDYSIYEEDGKTFLQMNITDNHYISGLQLATLDGGALSDLYPIRDADEKLADGTAVNKVTMDISNVRDTLTQNGLSTYRIKVDLFDYALNYTSANIILDPIELTELTLDKTELALVVGTTEDLRAFFTPTEAEQPVIWTTSDPAVATVDTHGAVTAIGPGTAQITAEAGGKTAVSQVTVTPIGNEGIVLNRKSMTLTIGASQTVVASTNLEIVTEPITWTSSDNTVVSVDASGVVKALTAGTATITATASGKSASIVITVEDPSLADYTIVDGVLVSYQGDGGHIAIPSQVREIGDYVFYYRDDILSVRVPGTVKKIGAYAFAENSHLALVTLEDGIESIGERSFYNSLKIKSIEVPDSVKEIGDYAFAKLGYLVSAHLGNGITRISNGLFAENVNMTTVNIPDGVTAIGDRAFYAAQSLKEIQLPSVLQTIGNEAFLSVNMDSLELPDTMVSIGDASFAGTKIATLDLGSGLQTIGKSAFIETQLQSLNIPDNVTTVGDMAFAYIPRLRHVEISKGATSLGKQVFDSNGSSSLSSIEVDAENPAYSSMDGVLFDKQQHTLVRYTVGHGRDSYAIPESVSKVDDYAFNYSTKLNSIDLGTTLATIGEFGFANSTSIRTLTIPDSVTDIGRSAFYHNDGLESVTVGSGVTHLNPYTFAYNANTRNIDLGTGVRSIGDYVFQYNSSLVEITFPEQVESLGDFVLSNNERLSVINIGKGVTKIGSNPFASSRMITSVNVNPENKAYASEDGVLLDQARTQLIQYPIAKPDAVYSIPSTVTHISNYAFQNAKFLTEVQFPEGLESVGISAFNGVSELKEVKFPNSLKDIGVFAFSDTGIESIVLGSQIEQVQDWAFAFSSQLKSVAILDSNTTIGSFAFTDSPQLTTVVLGEGVSIPGFAVFDANTATIFGWKGSMAEEHAINEGITFKVYEPITVQVKARHEAEAGTISLSAQAEGGIGAKSFSFRAWDAQTEQTVTLDTYAGATTYEWTLPEPGKYTVYADAKDETGVVRSGARELEVLSSGQVIISAVSATLTPAVRSYNISKPADVSTAINWNDAQSVTLAVYGVNEGPSMSVTDAVYSRNAMKQGLDYTIDGNTLTIKEGLLSALHLNEGDQVTVELFFDFGDKAVLTIEAIRDTEAPLISADISPRTATFDKKEDKQQDVTMNVTWNDASSIRDVTVNGESIGEGSYRVDGQSLVISQAYLATQPVGELVLQVQFDRGQAVAIVISIIDSSNNGGGNNGGGNNGGGNNGGGSSGEDIGSEAGGNHSGTSTSGGGATATVPATVRVLDASGNAITSFQTRLNASTGQATITVDEDFLTSAFAATQADAKGVTTVSITIEAEGAKSYEVVMPTSFLTASNASRAIHIKTNLATVTLPSNMLQETQAGDAEQVTLLLSPADHNQLDAAAQAWVGDRPVVDIRLRLGDRELAWQNNQATVTIAIPYSPTATELDNPEFITIQYIDEAGQATPVSSGRYNAATGEVRFTTNHFSKYAVAYVVQSFQDLNRHVWAKQPIEVLASKGIIQGTAANQFSPAKQITRAEYLTLLVKTLGLTANIDSNFTDVQQGSYYYEAAGIAKQLGIVGGTGNNEFGPNTPISRQDMMVMTYKALRKAEALTANVASVEAIQAFNDRAEVAGYAAEGVATLVHEGLITGADGKIQPKSPTTRAEAAVFLYRIYNLN